MRILIVSLLYTALMAAVNPLSAQALNLEQLRELRAGDMRKLVIHDAPKTLRDGGFETEDGQPIDLTDFAGKTLLVNFWATWCAPCRAEMPALDALNLQSGDDFMVLTIATGRNPQDKVDAFFDEVNIQTLPKYRDPTMGYARNLGVLGLPVTVVINTDGAEIARLQGEAAWDDEKRKSDSASATRADCLLAQSASTQIVL